MCMLRKHPVHIYLKYVLRPTDATIFFLRLHVATVVGVYETRAESSDNGLTELKKRTGQPSRKVVNANQPGRNNNLNVGSKRDKITKDIINAPRSCKKI